MTLESPACLDGFDSLVLQVMTGESNSTVDQSLDRLRRLVTLCEEFENALRSGKAPGVGDYLRRVPVAEQAALREELRGLEITFVQERRQSVGMDGPTIEDFSDTRIRTGEEDTASRWSSIVSLPNPRGGILEPSTNLGPYQIIEEIGRGGMAIVYRAFDPRISRDVAIKVLLCNPRSFDESVFRFQREKTANGRLWHPDVVSIFDVGEDRGHHYIVMEYLSGGSLAKRLHESPMADRPAAALIARVARAVHYSHSRGLIHRDLKPSNILLDDAGKPYVSDFGLVKFLGADPDLTETGPLLGTIPYMSPEQARAPNSVKEAADIYSLGATLYCALVGRPPFRAADPIETLRQIRDDPPPPLRKQNPSISRDLETLCLKCLEKSPARRFASAAEFADELERFVNHEPIQTRPPAWPERFARWVARRPQVAAMLAALFLMAAASFVMITLLWLQADRGRVALSRDSYFNHIALANQALAAHRTDQAEVFLEDCPGPLRGWEWRTLHRLKNEPATVLAGERFPLNAVDFAPDSGSLVTVGRRGEVRLWDLNAGRSSRRLPGPPEAQEIQDVAWLAHDGLGRIAFGCRDGLVYLGENQGGEWSIRALPRRHDDAVNRLAVDASGNRLLSCGEDGRVVLWDLATSGSTLLLTLKGRASAVAITPDGRRYAATGFDRKLLVGDCSGSMPREAGELADVGLDLAFGPDGHSLASGSVDGTVALWDPDGTGPARVLGRHLDAVNALAFCPKERRLASAGADGFVKLWDTMNAREAVSLEASARVEGLAFSRDGDRLAAACRDGSTILWDAREGPELKPSAFAVLKGHEGTIVTLAVSVGASYVASAGNDGKICLWDLRASEMTVLNRNALTPSKVNSVAFRGDGQQLATGGRDGLIHVWDVATRQEVGSVNGRCGRIGALAYSPDGRSIAFGGEPLVKLWRPGEPGDPRAIGSHSEEVYALAFRSGGDLIATGGADRKIRLWEPEGKLRGEWAGHDDYVEDLAFSRDGTILASAGGDRVAILWRVETGEVIRRLEGHASRVWGVAFSPDGRLLATAGGDRIVRIWEVATGRKRVELRGHTSSVYAVAFSPDGRFLASAGGDKTVRLWDSSAWAGP